MRRTTAFLVLVAVLSAITGCDFLRSVVGRPTSDDIRAKQAALLAIRADSIDVNADSVAAMQTIEEQHIKLAPPSHSGALVPEDTGKNYFVMVGTFSRKSNAEQLLVLCREAGYSPALIPYSNGYTAVAAHSCVTLKEALSALEDLKTRPFCPADAWIMSAK